MASNIKFINPLEIRGLQLNIQNPSHQNPGGGTVCSGLIELDSF